jgi:hypothetical protein
MRVALVFAVAAIAAFSVGLDAGQAPLPDSEPFLTAARENLARAGRVQDRFYYKERRTELHMNPFGKIGTGGTRVHEYTPDSEPGVYYRRLIERDGAPVADSKPERIDRRNRRPQGRSSVEDTASVLRFTLDRRERIDGRDVILVAFEPKEDARPETREGRLAKVLRGTVWIDEAAREVIRAEATAIDDVSYGLGVIARLREGASMSLTRERVHDQVWLPTSVRFSGEGRALLFRKLTIDHVIEWFDYKLADDPETRIQRQSEAGPEQRSNPPRERE